MIWLIILIEICLFIAGIYLLDKYDKEAGIQVNKKEYVVMGLIYATVEIVLFSFYGYGREFGCHSLILFYMIFAAYIDHKTKRVYRIGSIAFILLSVTLFISVVDMSVYERVERTVCILIFSMIAIMQGTLGWMGWGDVLTYIGAFFWLGTWKYDHITLELLATYMLLANVFFLIINVRRFDWNKKRFKEEVAFLPGMAVAMMIMELSRMLI